MYCTNCGKENNEDSKFCANCGTQIKHETKISSEPTVVTVEESNTSHDSIRRERNGSNYYGNGHDWQKEPFTYIDYFKYTFQHYATFSGRASQKEWIVFYIICMFIAFLSMMMAAIFDSEFFALLYGVFTLAIVIPTIAVSVRRLHDTGKSGWWYLITVIPLANLYLLYLLIFKAGDAMPNQYGDVPTYFK